MVSNQEKVMIIRKKSVANPVKSRFAKKSQKISTQLLTVLIMRAIVQIEQRKGNEKKGSPESVPNVL